MIVSVVIRPFGWSIRVFMWNSKLIAGYGSISGLWVNKFAECLPGTPANTNRAYPEVL